MGVSTPSPQLPAAPPGLATPDGAPVPSARNIWVDLLVYPTHSLPTAAQPVLVGLGLAVHHDVLAPWPALVGFLGSWVIHVAGLFTDNHELLRRHPKLPEHPELVRAVELGTLRLATLRAAIGACLLLAVATAPYLYRIGGAPVLALGALGIVTSLSYNGGPWAYARRGQADPLFVAMFGVVGVAGTYFIQAAAVHGAPEPWRLLASLPLPVYLVGLPVGALVTAVLLVDDIRDHEFDRVKGWRTGAVRRGPDFVRAEIAALVAFAYAAPFGSWLLLGLGPWMLLPLASLPMAVGALRTLFTVRERVRLIPLTPRMAAVGLVYSALLGLALALAPR